MQRLLAELHRRWAPLAAGAVWAAIVLSIRATGEQFNADYLGYGWQLIPYEILSRDPIGSVWNLHIQPPAFNLLIGAVGKLSPVADRHTFFAMQLVFGTVLAMLVTSILVHLRLRRRVALALGLFATLNTEIVRNAFEPTYEMVTAMLLAFVVWLVARHRLANGASAGRDLMLVAAALTAVVMTRSLYHPMWLVAILALVAWHWRESLRRADIAKAALIPLLIVGGWMAKNQVMFGEANLNSWFGMNLQRAVIPVLPEADRIALHDAGKISDIAMIGPFGNYGKYRDAMPPCTPEGSHEALTKELRDYPVPVPNLNYECFLPVYAQAGADAWAVIREHPGVWWDGRVWSARTWFASNQAHDTSPSTLYRQLGNVYQVARVDLPGVLSTNGWGQPIYGRLSVDTRFSLVALQLTVGFAALGAAAAWRILRRRATGVDPLVHAVVGATVAWTFVVGVVGELGEQARFRTMTDPLLYSVGTAALLVWLARRFGWSWVTVEASNDSDGDGAGEGDAG